jgi:site-specific recombinase XerD
MTNTTTATLHEAAQGYLEHLREAGKKERTIYTYAKDLGQIEAFFGADKPLAAIRTPQVGKFLKSDALLKLPSGPDGIQKPRAKPTVDKTVRVLRMFLVWAKDTGRIDALPLPKDTPMGRSELAQENGNEA